MSKKQENIGNLKLDEMEGQMSILNDFSYFNEETPSVETPKKEKKKEPKKQIEEESNESTEETHESSEPKESEKTHIGYDGEEFTDEQWNSPVVAYGPTRKEVEGWKARYDGGVYFTPFASGVYVWRELKRPEYREIISDQKLNALDREEFFTEKCVLFPYDFSVERIKKSSAGIASLLSEMIMDKSGFVAQSAPIKL